MTAVQVVIVFTTRFVGHSYAYLRTFHSLCGNTIGKMTGASYTLLSLKVSVRHLYEGGIARGSRTPDLNSFADCSQKPSEMKGMRLCCDTFKKAISLPTNTVGYSDLSCCLSPLSIIEARLTFGTVFQMKDWYVLAAISQSFAVSLAPDKDRLSPSSGAAIIFKYCKNPLQSLYSHK